jgi:hypothetical protein
VTKPNKIKRVGRGYRNFYNYPVRLLLRCGVDLQPTSTNHKPATTIWPRRAHNLALGKFKS